MAEEVAMAVGNLLLPGEVRHMGGHDAGGATAAAVGLLVERPLLLLLAMLLR